MITSYKKARLESLRLGLSWVVTGIMLVLSTGLEVKGQYQFIFSEQFDDPQAVTRWRLENAPGSKTNPTPPGVFTRQIENQVCNNYWIINNAHTPDNTEQRKGYRAQCNNLPNPYGGATNQSLHITYRACAFGAKDRPGVTAGTQVEEPDFGDAHSFMDPSEEYLRDNGLNIQNYRSNSDQIATLNRGFRTTGLCNIVVSFDAYMGGAYPTLANPVLNSSRNVIYSIDGGVTWKSASDNLQFDARRPRECQGWQRISVLLPQECDNKPDVRIGFRFMNNNVWPDPQDARSEGFNVDNIEVNAISGPIRASIEVRTPRVCRNQPTFISNNTTIRDVKPSEWRASYKWTFSGPGTVTYAGNTDDASVNPIVRFPAAGSYRCTLTVSTACTTVTATTTINVVDCPPTASYTSFPNLACATDPPPPSGSATVFTFSESSISSSAITRRTWTFTGPAGATPTFVQGTNANSKEAKVTFNRPGRYTVRLSITNEDGSSDDTTRANAFEIIDCACKALAGGGGADELRTVFNENFETNNNIGILTSRGWTCDLCQPGSDQNYWIVNNEYTGGTVTVFGFPLANIATVPNQNAAITGNARSNYLHVTYAGNSLQGLATLEFSNSNYFDGAKSRVCITSPEIDASELEDVRFGYYWIGNPGTNTNEISISVNNGPFQALTPPSPLRNQLTWKGDTIRDARMNKAKFKLRFCYDNTTGSPATPSVPDDFPNGFDNLIVRGVKKGGGGTTPDPQTIVCSITTPQCAGSTTKMTFTAAGTYNAGNVFTIQLSDANGSFANPTVLKTMPYAGGSETFETDVTIPRTTREGTRYRVRVVSSNPALNVAMYKPNTNDLTINKPDGVTEIVATNREDTAVCANANRSSRYCVKTPAPNSSYTWRVVNGTVLTPTSGTCIEVAWPQTAGSGQVIVTETFACGEVTDTMNVTIMPPTKTSLVSGKVSVCRNNQAQYTVFRNPGSTFRWVVEGGRFNPQPGPNDNFATVQWSATESQGRVKVIEQGLCGLDSSQAWVVILVSKPDVTELVGPQRVCANNLTVYRVGNERRGSEYTWTLPDGGGVLTGDNQTFRTITWGDRPGTYRVRVSERNDCGPADRPAEIQVTVNKTKIKCTASKTNAEPGEEITLTASPDGNAGMTPPYRFEWLIQGLEDSTGAEIVQPGDLPFTKRVSFDRRGRYRYRIILRDAFNCPDTCTGTIVVSSNVVTLDRIDKPGPFCAGESFNATVRVVGTLGTNNSYQIEYDTLGGRFNPARGVLGTKASNTLTDVVPVTIPANLRTGKYIIRAVSTPPFTPSDNTLTIDVVGRAVAGTLAFTPDASQSSDRDTVCSTTDSLRTLRLTGHFGATIIWESSTDNTTFTPMAGVAQTAVTYKPPLPATTTYYRARVRNGNCGEQTTNVITVHRTQINCTASSNAVRPGENVTFTVNSNAKTLNFPGEIHVDWQVNGVEGTSSGRNTLTADNLPFTVTFKYPDMGRFEYTFRLTYTTLNCADNNPQTCCSDVCTGTIRVATNVLTLDSLRTENIALCPGDSLGAYFHLVGTLSPGNRYELQYDTEAGNFSEPVRVLGRKVSQSLKDSIIIASMPIDLAPGRYKVRIVAIAGEDETVSDNTLPFVVAAPAVGGSLAFTTPQPDPVQDTLCVTNAVARPLTLTGFVGDTLFWESSVENLIFTPLQTPNPITTSFTPPIPNRTTFYRVRVKNGKCTEAVSNVVTVVIQEPAVVGRLVLSPTSFCVQTNLEATLNGFTPNPDSVNWYTSTDNEKFTRVKNIQRNATAITVPNLTTRLFVYAVLYKGSVCDSSRSNVAEVTVKAGSTAGVLSPTKPVLCHNERTRLTVTGSDGDKLTWQVRTGTGEFTTLSPVRRDTFLVTPPLSGPNTYEYRVIVQNGLCEPETTNVVKIVVAPDVKAQFDFAPQRLVDVPAQNHIRVTDRSIVFGSQQPQQDLKYHWCWRLVNSTACKDTFNTPGPINIKLAEKDTGLYQMKLTVTHLQTGCEDDYVDTIRVRAAGSVVFPSVFTPNGDRRNDVFFFKYSNLKAAKLAIFNRWGETIYSRDTYPETGPTDELTQPELFWNGNVNNGDKACPEGVYIYIFDATTNLGVNITQSGTVTLLR